MGSADIPQGRTHCGLLLIRGVGGGFRPGDRGPWRPLAAIGPRPHLAPRAGEWTSPRSGPPPVAGVGARRDPAGTSRYRGATRMRGTIVCGVTDSDAGRGALA